MCYVKEAQRDVGAILETKLAVKGKTFDAQYASARRHLPAHLKGEAEYLARAAKLKSHPKLRAHIDRRRVETAKQTFARALQNRDIRAERHRAMVNWAGCFVLNIGLFIGALMLVRALAS